MRRRRVEIFKRKRQLHQAAAARKTAFDWRAYLNRRDGLRLLRANKVHVDTLLTTKDGFSDTVHWQVIMALCPNLIEASRVVRQKKDEASDHQSSFNTWTRHIELPARVNSLLARQLLECAYGEEVSTLDRGNLNDFYSLSVDYNIDYAVNVCLNYAKGQLDVYNCIQMLLLAIEHRNHDLRRAAYSLLRSHFKLVLQVNRDFHLLRVDYLRHLLLDDFLKLNEDEEFAWLALVRWMMCRMISRKELVSMYNEMVAVPSGEWLPHVSAHNLARARGPKSLGANHFGPMRTNYQPPPPAPPVAHHHQSGQFNFHSPIMSFAEELLPPDANSNNKGRTTGLSQPDDNGETVIIRSRHSSSSFASERDESQLFELIKCLRFMRFRSVNAFNVILSNQHVQASERLTLLVNHMKLRYMIRKRLPLDSSQLFIQPDRLNKLMLSEMPRPKRLLNSMVRLVRCRHQSSQFQMGQQQQQRLQFQSVVQPVQSVAPSSPAVPPISNQVRQEDSRRLGDADGITKQQQANNGGYADLDWMDQLSVDCLDRADKPRVPSSVALLIGGWQDGAVSRSLLAYDFVCDKWFKLNVRLPEPRAFHASCAAPGGGQIFIFGGTNGEVILNSVLRFDPAHDVYCRPATAAAAKAKDGGSGDKLKLGGKLKESGRLVYRFHIMCPMRERRCHLSGVFHSDGRLYALGGHNGQQRLRSGEWFDSKSNQWHPIADMTIARSDASACSHDNKIFIAGGQISDQFIQSSVEFYKASDNTWTFAAPMIVPRMSFRLASFQGHLLAMGGTNGLIGGEDIVSVTRSVERYNSSLSSWSLCAPMSQKRGSFGVMNIENKLIVVGGFGGNRRLKTCEALRIGHPNSAPVEPPPPPQQQQPPPDSATPHEQGGASSQQQQLRQPSPRDVSQGLGAVAANQLLAIRGRGGPMSPTLRSAMKWVQRGSLPAKRSGFSIAVVGQLKNAKAYTYHGSLAAATESTTAATSAAAKTMKPSVVKRKGRWHRFKIIKRKNLIKHLKIALVVTIVILLV